jgi:hypothetical protein
VIAGHPDGEHAARIKLVDLCERILEACGVPADRPWDITEHEEEEMSAALPMGLSPGRSPTLPGTFFWPLAPAPLPIQVTAGTHPWVLRSAPALD